MTGEQLQARRKALGLSRRQLAMLLGFYEETLAFWEHGRRPIRWPIVLDLALEAIEARFARDGLLPAHHPRHGNVPQTAQSPPD